MTKYGLDVKKAPPVDAALQQTYFIVSGSPSNPILGGGDQICFGCKESPRVNTASQQTYFIVSGSPSNQVLWGVGWP